MDPITIIVSALSFGAEALAKGALGDLGKDLYGKLKEKITKKTKNNPLNSQILNNFEKKPSIWIEPTKELIANANIHQDQEIINLAKKFLDSQKMSHLYIGQIGNISNSNVNFSGTQLVGNNNRIVYVNQLITDARNQSNEVKEAFLDLRLTNGGFPIHYWLEEADDSPLFGRPENVLTREWWEPSHFSYQTIKNALLNRINQLGTQGWSIIEPDVDDLWVSEHTCKENTETKIANVFGLSSGHIWKHAQVYYGAKFHVKRPTKK